MYVIYKKLDKYTAQTISALADTEPDKDLYLEYREPIGDRLSGLLLCSFTSTSGVDCVNLNNFANTIRCTAITGHRFI